MRTADKSGRAMRLACRAVSALLIAAAGLSGGAAFAAPAAAAQIPAAETPQWQAAIRAVRKAASAQRRRTKAAAARQDNSPLLSPVLRLLPAQDETAGAAPEVALTLDLCMGGIDRRIFAVLLEHKIPATLFITGRWLENPANKAVIAQLLAQPQLFEIADHGANHVPAIDNRPSLYGMKTAGSAQAACAEAAAGLAAIQRAGFSRQTGSRFWYRGAGALYSPKALHNLQAAGFSIAGFSLNGDDGASLSAAAAFKRISAAKNGDVIIAHMNQPGRPAGFGVADGILALQRRGYRFVTLSQARPAENGAPLPITALADSYPSCAILRPQQDGSP